MPDIRLLWIFWIIIGGLESTQVELEDPFVFPFGPAHNDTFNLRKTGRCLAIRRLSDSFRFGPGVYSSLAVCLSGNINLLPPYPNISAAFIFPLFSDIDTKDEFLDQMCGYLDTNFPYRTPCQNQSKYNPFTFFEFWASLNARLKSLTSLDQDLCNTCRLIPKSKPTFQNFSIEKFEFLKFS